MFVFQTLRWCWACFLDKLIASLDNNKRFAHGHERLDNSRNRSDNLGPNSRPRPDNALNWFASLDKRSLALRSLSRTHSHWTRVCSCVALVCTRQDNSHTRARLRILFARCAGRALFCARALSLRFELSRIVFFFWTLVCLIVAFALNVWRPLLALLRNARDRAHARCTRQNRHGLDVSSSERSLVNGRTNKQDRQPDKPVGGNQTDQNKGQPDNRRTDKTKQPTNYGGNPGQRDQNGFKIHMDVFLDRTDQRFGN